MHAKMRINFGLDLVRIFTSEFKAVLAKIKSFCRFLQSLNSMLNNLSKYFQS